MTWWQYFLFPFSVLYDLLTKARNWLYDNEIIKPIHFDANVIGVGNLSVGGTGKTPMVSYLATQFNKVGAQVSILSRGYGRSSGGFRQVTHHERPATVGDEPFMYFLKHPEAGIFVDKERDLGIPQLLFHRPETQVILMDDAFQHRVVEPDLNILLTTYQNPFYEDYLLPSGRLRERRIEAKRAGVIVVTKCPGNLSSQQQDIIKDKIEMFSTAPVFFAGIEFQDPQPIFEESKHLMPSQVGISGIAKPETFEAHLQANFRCRIIHHFKDHHKYSSLDIKHITNELDENTSLLTTEKDMVKLREFNALRSYSCYYIPIRMKFLKDEALFLSTIDSHLKPS